MNKSLTAALSSGLRPLSIKAALTGWLGLPATQVPGYWSGWGTSSFLSKQVTVEQALQLSTASACVRLISETQGTLPLGFYQRETNGSRTAATSHDLYEILHNQPNANQTAVVFWEVAVASMLLWGNAFIEIIRSGKSVVALHFLHPARITMRRLAGGGYEYLCRDEDSRSQERTIREENMMHIPAFSTDGVLGLSPIIYGTNIFGTAIETDKASATTFQGSLRSPGIITMDMILGKEQREQVRAHVKNVSDSGGVMVLEKGTSFTKLGFDPVSAELLASRSWNVEEIARWFRVDPSMIGHGGKDSNWGTGLEQKMIWFLTFTLRPWCVRIEQAVRKSLLTPVERKKYFAEFAIEGLLRADSAARAAFYSVMTQNALMTRDECRAKENLPPMGGNAAVLTLQSAMINIDDMNQGSNAAEEQEETREREDDFRKAASISHTETIRAIKDLGLSMKAQPINVDARTTVEAAPPANVIVNVPETKAAPINVDARTTVSVPEQKAPNVHVDAPNITVVTPSGKTKTTPVRDDRGLIDHTITETVE